MSASGENKFAIKHVFKNVKKMETYLKGEKVYHYNVPWRVFFFKNRDLHGIHLLCLKSKENEFLIETSTELKLLRTTGDETFHEKNLSFTHDDSGDCHKLLYLLSEELHGLLPKESLSFKRDRELDKYLVDGNLTVELTVTINKASGINMEKLRNFDESMKEFSDVVLIVKDEKFDVSKLFLASHSSYFKSLLLGNFNESGKSEIELKDIDPWDFQNFLEVVHGEPAVNDDTVDGILKLADMYYSKTAIRRCEEFFVNISKRSLKAKFNVAMKYKMDGLTQKCFSEMKTFGDIESIMPEDPTEIDYHVWKQLLQKSLQFNKS